MKDAQNNELRVQPILAFEIEQNGGLGEDASVCFALPESRAALIASLDGCGGAGAKKYTGAENWTGAKIASHSCGRALNDWFLKNSVDRLGIQDYPAEVIADSLAQALRENIELMQSELNKEQGQSRMMISSLIRPFPTTLSCVLLSAQDDGSVRCLFLWAGDSRGFLLTKRGLMQITEDDLKEKLDPFENIVRDGVLGNVISAKPFYINVREVVLKEPCLLLTATDGCFAYFRSPMDFEYTLLETLARSNTPKEWNSLLMHEIGTVASDDYTMNALSYGFDSFEEIRRFYAPTLEQFCAQYGGRTPENSSYEELRAIWDKYKEYYMRALQ